MKYIFINFKCLLILFVLVTSKTISQNKTNSIKTYEFNVYDGSESFTMYQFNQNYLSSYRIFSRTIDDIFPNKKVGISAKAIFVYLIGMPLTHEEGHRSVLTHKGIGSISQPFFNSKGAAYVKGVTNNTLINLRENDFSNYIRLHTAGLESDQMITSEIENLLFFNEETFDVIKEEYVFRKLSPVLYNLTTFIPSLSPKIKEENDELKSDIVGHDIWGMVRHLHRPEMEFYRYTDFDDLNKEEKRYAKKLAWRSFSNFLNPMFFGKIHFNVNENLKGNASIVHSLAPFGDYFEQNFLVNYKNKLNTSFYIREYMNRNDLFMAGGATLHNVIISNKITSSISFDVWKQPKNLDFNTSLGQLGGNGNIKINYQFSQNNSKILKRAGIYSEIYYKSEGFLPEYASLKDDFGLRFGLSFSY